MKIHSNSFTHGGKIPAEFAFGRVGDAGEPCVLSANRNPHLMWEDVPAGTQSFALICVDPDAPSRGDDVNIAGHSVSARLPRTEFYHWVVANLPANLREIAAGSVCDGITVRGKQDSTLAGGGTQGINDYTGWFAGDADMRGEYLGYDGPCPPFNDEIPHRYCFRLFALDVPALNLPKGFTAAQVYQAMHGHVLDEAMTYGTYALNPAVK